MFISQLIIAVSVFLSIYLIFFLLIRLFADMAIVGTSLVCAGIAFLIPPYYESFRTVIHSIGILSSLGIRIPETPTTIGMIMIASSVVVIGVLICLPFLPFSETYRAILGGKPGVTEVQVKQLINNELANIDELDESKIKQWIREELARASTIMPEIHKVENTPIEPKS
ncbi:MAG: hypothetical protein R3E08_06520 [Thiotrichaceae bacterium]